MQQSWQLLLCKAAAHLPCALLQQQALARLGLLHLCPVGCISGSGVPVNDPGGLNILLYLCLLHVAAGADQIPCTYTASQTSLC